ncbi:MAG: hypothetical protein COT90_03315 [Candidatus Diapherotrites archaeon CG10_big_fil_rev_8_21_14_0_10_31_34]|nr:MAG: hypothetical protein COT90_03315 [Candidatus Diapherotrites archaeon CG10_big_fil_rev_8_21_14_0_10_31_34]
MEKTEILTETEENPFVVKFEQFFVQKYKKQIERLASVYPEKKSLEVNFKELEEFDFELADSLLENPDYLLEAAQLGIKNIDVPILETENFEPFIRFYNLPKDSQPLLKDIGAIHLGKLISVEGVIRQITEVLPRLKVAKWECRSCGNTYKIHQSGTTPQQPVLCECKRKDFRLLAESSEFIDSQKIEIQEPLEHLKGSDQAVNLEVYATNDLVNKVSAGDRTRITGMLRLRPPKEKKLVFTRFLDVLHLEETAREFEDVEISKEEEEKIRELAKKPEIYELLTQSIAPAIYGHERVKEAIVFQLFGGVKKNLPGKATIRGNIHVLLVGDPGVAKSQILMAVNNIAPKAIYVAGKTSSGVGLCVSPESMILNDNGFKEIGKFIEERFDEKKAIEEAEGIKYNEVSMETFALNNSLKTERKNLSKIWKINAPEKMTRIKLQSGKFIEITPNTKMLRIKEGKVEWIKSMEIQEKDFVASARELPEGLNKPVYSIEVLSKDKNTRIKDNVSETMQKITDKLAEKYGSIQKVTKKYGLRRDNLYFWRSKKLYTGMPLNLFFKMGLNAEFEKEFLSKQVKTVFNRYGKNILIPQALNNKKLCYLAGLVFGDGSIYLTKENQAGIRFYNSDKELLKEFDKIIFELFGLKTEKLNEKDKVPGRRINSVTVWKLLKEFGLSNKKIENKLSHFCTEQSNELLSNVLKGLYDTDGYTSKSSSPHVGLTTISKKLALTVQLSLLKFGIQSKVRERKKEGVIAKGKNITVKSNHNQFYIESRGKKNLELFYKKIGFGLKRKNKSLKGIIEKIPISNPNIDVVPEISSLLKEIRATRNYNPTQEKLKELIKNKKNELLEFLSESNVVWEQVKSKEFFKPEYNFVYDFTVENSHNFIANGIIVHNTASAVKDDFGEGGWTLKAGALVLASGGLANIDEFDKMDKEDRSAMHEAMEQQMVSIAKAGIVTRFKTETSILAAANPKFSRFDPYEPFIKQIDLPSTLISRFDLFFMIRDVLDKVKDEEITASILKTHKAGEMMLQKGKRGKKETDEMEELKKLITPAIDTELLKKYISFARQKISPVLSAEAIKTLTDFYLGLREMGKKEGSYAATHRQLEGLVRLSEASARVRLSDTIEKSDAEKAVKLLKNSLQDVVTDPETGRIDMDIINIGTTHSKLTALRNVLNIVRQKSKEQDLVPIIEVIEEAKTLGLEKERVNEIISELKRKGELYEKKHGFISPVEK